MLTLTYNRIKTPVKRCLSGVVIGSFAGSLLLGFLLWQSPPQQLQEVLTSNTSEAKAFPLFYMHDVKTTQYAMDGSPAYLLETKQFNLTNEQSMLQASPWWLAT